MNDPMQDSDFTTKENQLPNQLDTNGYQNTEYSVNVSIEPNHESEILEIKYDGQEIYKQPPSYSDNLAQLISKIDFTDIIEEKQSDSTNSAQQKQQLDKNELITARKFYQNVFERVKLSLDEVMVLLDVLSIVRANKLMTIETGTEYLTEYRNNEATDKTLNLLLKKKNIEKVKGLLKKSLEKISNDQEYSNIKFHLELYRARQLWRISKKGNRFFCDLSYRSVGCVNATKIVLELYKNDLPLNPLETNPSKALYLSVIVPEEFTDYAYIQVKIIKTTNKANKHAVFDSKFSLFTYQNASNVQGCQEILEREQNSVYCKEIYNKLLSEIFDPNNQSQLKPIIIGNSIQLMITMEYDLIISLVHTHDKQNNNEQTVPKDYSFDNSLLEYYLHCLLKKSFDQNFFHFDQKPITSTFAYNTQVKIAGMAYANLNFDDEDSVISVPQNIAHLLSKKKKINLLQSIKEKAEHLILRKRILKILSKISKRTGETHLHIEQSAWNSPTTTDITVTISSYYYTTVAKSFFYILIKKSQVSVLNRSDNISISFTDSLEDFKDYFINQCSFHQINLILTLCQLFGWSILGNSFTNEPNNKHMIGLGLVYNNDYSKKIAIKVATGNKIQIFVNQYNVTVNADQTNVDQNLKSLFGDMSVDWIFVKDNFNEIHLDSYPGFSLMQKFELFLAHFSTPDLIEL